MVSSVVNKDLTFKAKAKDLALKAKAKDLTHEARAKDLKPEQVEGPLWIRGVKEHKKLRISNSTVAQVHAINSDKAIKAIRQAIACHGFCGSEVPWKIKLTGWPTCRGQGLLLKAKAKDLTPRPRPRTQNLSSRTPQGQGPRPRTTTLMVSVKVE